jgi:NAD(P)-dependent dehydrogenase (short-subunit alcohol dehydrogenase family)
MKIVAGHRALVTGAASGIGRAIALALADAGCDVAVLDRDERGLAEVCGEIERRGRAPLPIVADLSRPESIPAAAEAIRSAWGRLDILVNNAGVVFYGPTEAMTAEQWDWLLRINLYAPVHLTRELLPLLLAQPQAHVLNVCSISGLVAGSRIAAYHTSKFGLVGVTQALRAEFGRRGLGVTALCPGPVSTNLYQSGVSGRAGRAIPEPPRWLCATPEAVARKALGAIRRNRRQVLVTPLAHLLFQVNRFAPWLLDWLNHFGRKKPAPATVPVPTETTAAPASEREVRRDLERAA